MKYQVGEPVFFYTTVFRYPGIIESGAQGENGNWIYDIRVGSTMVVRNVYEHLIEHRKILDAPKYTYGDKVRFRPSKDEEYEGTIKIVDAFGTFEQVEEPSYDILVKGNPGCLHKHVRESMVIGFAEEGKGEML